METTRREHGAINSPALEIVLGERAADRRCHREQRA
jgi:hypothetical protein